MTAAQPSTSNGVKGPDGATQEKGAMEQIIEALASGVCNGVAWLAEHGILFAFFLVLWVAFGAALVWSQGSLHDAWEWVRGLPLIVQGIVWLRCLPVMAGLWVWETSWPLIVRLVLILSIAGWNLLVLLPRALPLART